MWVGKQLVASVFPKAEVRPHPTSHTAISVLALILVVSTCTIELVRSEIKVECRGFLKRPPTAYSDNSYVVWGWLQD